MEKKKRRQPGLLILGVLRLKLNKHKFWRVKLGSAGWWRWCMVQHITTCFITPQTPLHVLFFPCTHSSSAFRKYSWQCLDSQHKAAPNSEAWTFLFSVNMAGVKLSREASGPWHLHCVFLIDWSLRDRSLKWLSKLYHVFSDFILLF